MDEAEWLACDDPGRMLDYVGRGCDPTGLTAPMVRVSPRRMRLFACACCRAVWDGKECGACKGSGKIDVEGGNQFDAWRYCPSCRGAGRVGGLADPRSRRAVEVAERFADGEATAEELQRVHEDAWGEEETPAGWAAVRASDPDVLVAVGPNVNHPVPPAAQAALLREVVGNPFCPPALERCPRCEGDGEAHGSDRPFEWSGPGTYPGPCPVCRGFRYVRPPWLTPQVLALAQACYDDQGGETCGRCGGEKQVTSRWRIAEMNQDDYGESISACPDCGGTGRTVTTGHLDPARLAVLADALEEAGATDAALLGHLRGVETVPAVDGGVTKALVTVPLRGPHVRGCWAIDLVLGKE